MRPKAAAETAKLFLRCSVVHWQSTGTRKYVSGGQRKQPGGAGLPPEFAQGTWPLRPNASLDLIRVGRPQRCEESDCTVQVTPGERALYNREDGSLYCLRCVTFWIVRATAGRPADDRELAAREICRLYEAATPDALPDAVRAATLPIDQPTLSGDGRPCSAPVPRGIFSGAAFSSGSWLLPVLPLKFLLLALRALEAARQPLPVGPLRRDLG